jgi:Holliday junction resolvase RusA-like endonuclease
MYEIKEPDNYLITIFNKKYLIKKFTIFIMRSNPHLFLGKLSKSDIIPNINCIYINSENKIILRTIRKIDTNYIDFEVYGNPHGKMRPRFKRIGKFVTTYTDNKTVKAEEKIRNIFLEKINNLSDKLKDKIKNKSNIKMEMIYHMPIPSSLSKKKKKELINTYHIKKPDIDNLIKTVLDGLNKYAYNDDSLISELSCKKIYSKIPKTYVKINY